MLLINIHIGYSYNHHVKGTEETVKQFENSGKVLWVTRQGNLVDIHLSEQV